ncbi:MAG: hypothetical protein GX572_05680 [Clostridia bacterium]|nr:hypothetical protein [Clostridia bacterium]
MNNAELMQHKEQFRKCMEQYQARVVVCGGTGCMANGSADIIAALAVFAKKRAWISP